nr:MFS transporter [Altericroceibacterium endophyticum]
MIATTVGNGLTTTPAVHAVFGTFLIPLSESFGWSRASISVVLAILAATCAVGYPIAGRFADRHGTRRMLLLGNVLFAASIAALALSNGSLALFYVTFTLIGIFGAIPSTPILSKVVAEWFPHNGGTALGFTAGVGNGIGSVIMPVAAALLITHYGWRAGYLGMGAIVLLAGLPVMYFLLRDAPGYGGANSHEDKPAIGRDDLDLKSALRYRSFWLIFVSLAAGAGILTAIFSHVVPILQDRGVGIGMGTTVLSVFALVGALWQIVSGRILEKVRGPLVLAPMYAMALAGLLLLEYGHGAPLLILAGVFLGVALGAQYSALRYLVMRYFGVGHFGVILGIMYSGVIVAQGILPVLFDASFDAWGSYRSAINIACVVLAVGTALLLWLPRYRLSEGRLAAS